MIRLLLADDHAIVRKGVRQIISMAPDIEVIAEAGSGAEVLDFLRNGELDLLLLDMTMPGISGIDLITRIRAHYPALPILILSMHNDVQVVSRALKAGAGGYATKDGNLEDLLRAIRKVAAGGRYIDPGLAEKMVFNASDVDDGGAPHARLSNRELEVFELLAQGHSVNQIAERLAISNKTVSTHKNNLMEKMNFNSSADIVRYAIQFHLFE